MGKDIFLKIKKFLDNSNVKFECIEHDHVHTSADAAKVRGNKIEQAAKAIILKAKKRNGEYSFIQCILSGNKKINFKALKKHLDLKSISLASPEEVLEKTTCTIGSVPPFGKLFNLEVYMDESVLEQKHIVFSAGTHNDSIKMSSLDFKEATKPVIFNFSF